MDPLHRAFAAQRDYLRGIGKLGEREAAFFADSRLKTFWRQSTACLTAMAKAGWTERDAAAQIVGGFLTPLWLGYGVTENRGHGEVQSPKAVLLDSAARSNALRSQAVRLAHELADLLDKIGAEVGAPDTLRLWELAQDVLPQVVQGIKGAKCHVPIPTAAYGPRVSAALRHLAKTLEEPVAFQAPGLRSAKVTWRDWLREAHSNATETLDPPLILRETDWVALVRVLVTGPDSQPSRSSVADALRESALYATDDVIFPPNSEKKTR